MFIEGFLLVWILGKLAYQQGRQTILWEHRTVGTPLSTVLREHRKRDSVATRDSHKQTPLVSLNRGCGSGGISWWIRIQLSCWIRNRIQVLKVHFNIQISKMILIIFFSKWAFWASGSGSKLFFNAGSVSVYNKHYSTTLKYAVLFRVPGIIYCGSDLSFIIILNPDPDPILIQIQIWFHVRSGYKSVPKLKMYQDDRKWQIFLKCRVYSIVYCSTHIIGSLCSLNRVPGMQVSVILLWYSSWHGQKLPHENNLPPLPPPTLVTRTFG